MDRYGGSHSSFDMEDSCAVLIITLTGVTERRQCLDELNTPPHITVHSKKMRSINGCHRRTSTI